MFALMLCLRYKNLIIVSTFVGNELRVDVIEEYDKKAFSSMLLKIHQFLHSLATFELVAKRASDENFNLDILKMSFETILVFFNFDIFYFYFLVMMVIFLQNM
jgi:hypothetical protein